MLTVKELQNRIIDMITSAEIEAGSTSHSDWEIQDGEIVYMFDFERDAQYDVNPGSYWDEPSSDLVRNYVSFGKVEATYYDENGDFVEEEIEVDSSYIEEMCSVLD